MNDEIKKDMAVANTGGIKNDQGKPDLSLIPLKALIEVGAVMTFGAKKYGDFNWLKGLSYTRLSSAALRHIFAWLLGEDLDPESGLSHLAHAACCVLMLLEFVLRLRKDLDNRYVENKS